MPAPRPAYNTPIDATNPLNADVVFATWFGEDPADDTVLTDVSGNGYDGTLVNLIVYAATVSGGSPAGVNGTYLPVGSEWQNATYAIAEDPMMGAGYWVLYPIGGYPDMDGMYWGDGDATPWGSTWGSIAVAQGDQQGTPWEEDGLAVANAGYAGVNNAALRPGTGDFSVVWLATPDEVAGGRVYMDMRNPSDPYTGWAIGLGADASTLFVELSGATRAFFNMSCSSPAMVADTLMVMAVTVDRDGYARVYRDGAEIGSVDISSAASNNVAGTNPLKLGGHHTDGAAQGFDGTLHAVLYYDTVLTPTQVADIHDDIYALAEQASTAVSAVAASSFAAGLAVSGSAPTSHAAGVAVSADAPTSFAAGVDAGSTGVSAAAPTSFAAGLDVTAEAPTSLAATLAVTGAAGTSFAAGHAVSAQAPTSYAVTPAYVYWIDDLPGASYGKLCIAEEDVQVVDDFGAVADQGWQLSVCDGALRYTAWFREDGCNLQGMGDVKFDFTDRRHRVELECQSGRVKLLVDGMLLQTGGAAGPTTRTVLAWGSWIPDDF